METKPLDLSRLENYGFTDQGAAIVDAVWFNSYISSICMCLICNPAGVWKAYIGVVNSASETLDAKATAENGAKVPYAIAAGAFPNRFTEDNYDPVG